MTNKKLIEKILKRIDYKTHTLAKIITIEDNKFKWIIPYGDKNYDFYLSGDEWEIPLDELTNRELIKNISKLMSDLIEYSFNAFDSELTHYVWTIPEGYTAKIEDGKNYNR